MHKPKSAPVIVRQEGVLGGRPSFRGTRVQAEILFDNLAAGRTIDEIVENFPTLDPNELRLALKQACELILKEAPRAAPGRAPEITDAGSAR